MTSWPAARKAKGATRSWSAARWPSRPCLNPSKDAAEGRGLDRVFIPDVSPVVLAEQRFLPVFDKRDLRWSNELLVKTSFLITLFNDIAYIMDPETAIARGYCDLSLIVRPDRRQYTVLDHVIDFKHLKIIDLPGISSEELARIPWEVLRERPEVAALLTEAEEQLARYRQTLEGIYGDRLKLRTHALVCIGLARFVW